jgi:hypothetical protein
MPLKIQFNQDILDYTNERECKNKFSLDTTITGLDQNTRYKIDFNIESLKYFDTIPENLNRFSFSPQTKTIIATKTSDIISTSLSLSCIKSAIVKVKIENLTTYEKSYDYVLVKCPLCNDINNSIFSVDLVLNNLGLVDKTSVAINDCTISTPMAAVGKNLTVGRKYKCEFVTSPVIKSEVDFTSSEIILNAGDIEQNFGTIILINKNKSFFFLSAKLTDLSTGVSVLSDKYFCSCAGASADCGSLTNDIDIQLDKNPFIEENLEPSAIQTVSFLDTVNNEPIFIDLSQIYITNVKYNGITYPDSTVIVDGIDGHSLLLSVKPGLSIGEGSVLTCWLSVKMDSYLDSGQTIVFSSKSSNTLYRSLNTTNLPSSVTKDKKVLFSGANGLVDNLLLTCPANDTKTEKCEIRLQQNTILKDANGDNLTGNITFTAYHFDNDDVSSLSTFPGGMIIADSYNLDGSSNLPGVFYSYGFLAIEAVDDSGKRAKYLSGGNMNVTAEINEYNLSTTANDSFMRNGDEIRVWSLDSNTGSWQEEVRAPLVNNSISFNTNHMSYWNFDAFIDDVCENLILDFPADMVSKYRSIIDTSGLYLDQVNEVLGGHNIVGIRRRSLVLPPQKTDPGEIKLNIRFYPKKYNNNINYAKFVFYTTIEDFSKGTNPIGEIIYSNTSSGRTSVCNCSSVGSSCSTNIAFTPTPTNTPTKSNTPTPTATLTNTPTPTLTPSCTDTPVPTPTNTPTTSITPSITLSGSATPTPTPTKTQLPQGVGLFNG